MNPTPVETITYVPADSIIPSRPTTLDDVATIGIDAAVLLIALLMIWRMSKDSRAVRHVRKQSKAIGVAAVGMALRIEETRKGISP